MESERVGRKPPMSGLLWSGLVYLVSVIASLWVAKSGSPIGSATIAALGTAVVAAINARRSAYPAFVWWTITGIMSVSLLGTAIISTPEQWEKARDGMWMYPWYLLMLASLPAPKRGVCSPSHAASGWMLVGTGVILGAIFLVTTRI